MKPQNKAEYKTSSFGSEIGSLNKDSSIRSSEIIHAFTDKPGKVFLLYGERAIFNLSLQMAAHAIAKGKAIAVVDGCNQFDVHALANFARIRKIDPNKFLNRIFISRGFTCYQIEQAVANKLPPFLAKINSNTALIFGLLNTFYDEQASVREVQQILKRLLVSFQDMKANGISLLLVCSENRVEPEGKNALFNELKKEMDRVYKLDVNEQGILKLYLESQHIMPKGEISYGKNSANIYQSDR